MSKHSYFYLLSIFLFICVYIYLIFLRVAQFIIRLAKHKWRSSKFKTIEKPEAIKKTAFQLAIENDWPGVAYSILEDGAIILLDAFKVSKYSIVTFSSLKFIFMQKTIPLPIARFFAFGCTQLDISSCRYSGLFLF